MPRAPRRGHGPRDLSDRAPLLASSETARRASLIHPDLLLYFPCARQPALADGAVEVPQYFVWFDHPDSSRIRIEPTSPFLGVHDLYPVQRLPLTDGTNPPAGVVVYEVERAIPDR